MKIKVAKFIADFMANMGVKHIFTVTGGGAMHLNDAFGHHELLTCIYNHHEQACSIAAEGYARLTGNIAAVCVTSGPGGTNAITGVLGAWQDSIPMFVVSGQVKRITTTQCTGANVRQLGDQEFQITQSVANMTKYAVMVTEAQDILYHLQKAWYLANSGRKGPVWLDIPLDIQGSVVEMEQLREFHVDELEQESMFDAPAWKEEYVSCVKEILSKAKRPVILAGTGIRLAGAYDEFLSFADELKIPILTAWNAHDLLWENHPFDCGRPGTVGLRGGNFIIQNADVVLVLGCRLNIRMISYQWELFAKDAIKVVVDIDERELCKPTIKADVPIHADVLTFMRKIRETKEGVSNLCENMQKDWLFWCKSVNVKYPACREEYWKDELLNPYVFIDCLFGLLCEKDTIVCGNGSACVITFQGAKMKKGQRLFTNSGCAAMGYGFPASIGAAIAKGEDTGKVICIDGDGSFQMNLQELQTVVQNGIELKIVILNNNGYHSIRQTQKNLFKGRELVGVSADNGVSFPDMEKIAYAYGVGYQRISSLNDCVEKLKKALEYSGAIIIEAIVDERQNFEPKLSSKVLEDGSIVSPPIDDMFPFLSREEYEENKRIVRE